MLLRTMGINVPENTGRCLTVDDLTGFLKHHFPDRDQSNWSDRAHLLQQLNEIEITNAEALTNLLWRAEPALQKDEAGLLSRMLGKLSATGAVRTSMWSVDKRAADTCIGGRQIFRRFHRYVRP